MKLHLLTCLLVSSVTAFAQNDAVTKPDPFVKDKSAGQLAQASPPPGAEVGGIRFVFETYSLSRADLDGLLSSTGSKEGLFDGVQKLVSESKAVLDLVQSVVTKPGDHAAVEAGDDVFWATEFDYVPNRPARPTNYELRSCRDRVELEAALSSDGRKVDVNFASECTRLVKWMEAKASPPVTRQVHPLFGVSKLNANVSLPLDQSFFLGTMSDASATGIAEADGGDRVSLLFVRASIAAVAAAKAPDVDMFRFTCRTYQLERREAAQLLRTQKDDEALLQAVQALVKTGKAELEHLTAGLSKAGQRAVSEEVGELFYGNTLGQSGEAEEKGKGNEPAQDEAIFTSFEMHPLGWRLEWEGSAEPQAGKVDLVIAPEHSELRGQVAGHPLLEQLPQKPVIATRKVNVSRAITIGHSGFIGTFNYPRETGVNGRQDDGKTGLMFVEVVPW